MTIDRRSLLASGIAFSAAASFPAAAAPAGRGGCRVGGLAPTPYRGFLVRSPEEATSAGFDIGTHAALRSKLDDRSLASRATDRAAIVTAQALLARIDRTRLSPRAQLDHDVAAFVYATLAETLGRYGYVDANLRPSPYVVSQMNGAYYWMPDFIGSSHPIATAADVDGWYARLSALGVALDQETGRIAHDASIGVVPPGFVIDRAVAQIERLRDAPPRQSALMVKAIGRAQAVGLGDIGERGESIFRASIAPALDRQAAALRALRPQAVDTAGVWRLPDGDAYYATALLANTTTRLPAEELHRSGIDQCDALLAEIDAALRAQGLTQGSVGARITALNTDRRFTVGDDDAGRARLLAAAQDILAKITARLPQAFGDTHVDPLVVRRTPAAIEDGAPGAFYSEGVGGQPGTYSLNLKRPGEHPLWRLPTLTHHEGIPGHHFQYSVLAHQGSLPLFRRVVRFSSYTEGYALYAQQVADEVGVYADDPFGRIGYLQSELFRAARIVVDTGIHHKRWTREQAVDWMVDRIGESRDGTDREVVRYCVYPGQACSFKVGANRIVAAREAARKAMGARFDVRAFHDLVLQSGPVPMAVLESAVAQWSGTRA